MSTLFDMRSFFEWLEQARERELVQRRDQLHHAISRLFTESDVIADARYLLKQIEQELLARTIK